MDVVSAILGPVTETLMVPVKRHLGYLISCTKYVRDMGIKMRKLNAARVDVEVHINRNRSNRLEVPAQATVWLEEVEKLNAKAEKIPSDAMSCLKLQTRHTLGRKAFKMIEEIESVITDHSLITWTDLPIPLGRVGTMEASTSTSTDHHDFQSREQTFKEALKALGPNDNSHMVALCGMGGVGKTTMMRRLNKAVQEKKMFNFIVEAVIGEKTDPIAIQQAVADYLGVALEEKTKQARADKLSKSFMAKSDGGNNKFLIILDDVWQFIDMNDIGLSPLPNQGVDFKVLLTSRDRDVCAMMGVEATSIFNVKVLIDAEAQSFFCQFVQIADPDLHKIGEDIVRKCCGLPIAIKTMACTLRNKSKDAWNDALSRLKHHDNQSFVNDVFEMSYNNLQDEEIKTIFLLCGLFPEDFNIPTEDLMRYGWGLKVFTRVYNIGEARCRLNACIERLMASNLLIESDDVGFIKMHDLVRAFVLDMFSKVENASIVDHNSMSGWPESDMSGSCTRISLTCNGMSEFPRDLKFPNLLILKLMRGRRLPMFRENFYEEMEKLKVISYEEMMYPLLPSSLECSTNLQVLRLHKCSLMFDCSSIGNLLNLEVLSFVDSFVEWLPYTIGNLKKLRILDMTNCFGLRIDDGVLKQLVKLEELYLKLVNPLECDMSTIAITLTDSNCTEMAERSKTLSAFEFEFFQSNLQPKNISFKNLHRFRISVGSYLYGYSRRSTSCRSTPHKFWYSFGNVLKLVMKKDELLESRINELLKKTNELYLRVEDMKDLSDIAVKSSHPLQSSSFHNLRVLLVSECAELRYLFTLGVAKTLSKLEHLEISSCCNMEELIHVMNGEKEVIITFPKLMFLSLHELPKLSGLCHNVNIIELPQLVELELESIPNITSIYPNNKLETSCLLKGEGAIPKLDKLDIGHMENLKEIWPREFSTSEEAKLREIKVSHCDNLVNLFPCNPMPFLHHLEELRVECCGSIKVLFNIDLDSVGGIGLEDINSSLRKVEAYDLGNLREVWRIKGAHNSCPPIRFQAVERLMIHRCKRFNNVVTPSTINFDLGAVMEIYLSKGGESEGNNELVEDNEEQEISKVRPYLIDALHNLRKLTLYGYDVDVVFETTTQNNQQSLLLPGLEDLCLYDMKRMSHVWKLNWNEFLILQKQVSKFPFHNLTTINLHKCHNIKYLFSPLMAKLLSNLKKVEIRSCDGIEQVVSNRDDEDDEKTTSTHTRTNLFPHLVSLTLACLSILKCIDVSNGGSNGISFNNITTSTTFSDKLEFSQAGGVSWSLCQYAREISIFDCDALSSVIPCYAAGKMQKLQVLRIEQCKGMKEVFETQGVNNNSGCPSTVDEGNGSTPAMPRVDNGVMFQLSNLKILEISFCEGLEHVFLFSALGSLRQLEELKIEFCREMKVIVKEEEASSKEVLVFPRLKSIKLAYLPELLGFFLGMNEFRWPSLDTVMIKECPKMTVFAPGGSTAPKLKYIQIGNMKYGLEHGLNFHALHQTLFSSSECPATSSEGRPWSFHNFIELDVKGDDNVRKIIPSNEFLQLQKLEKIRVSWCRSVEEVFEGGRNSSGVDNELQTTTHVILPNLTQLDLEYLDSLKHIWNSNAWTRFEFSNLTTLSVTGCRRLQHVFTGSMVGSLLQLQELHISWCDNIEEVFVEDSNVAVEQEEEECDGKMNEIIRLTRFEFPNLTTLSITGCRKLQHVLTGSMAGSLLQLQELRVSQCLNIEEVIVEDSNVGGEQEEEECDGNMNEIIRLPCLKSVELDRLKSLKGFSLGKKGFSIPLLDTLIIMNCPAITIFTKGSSKTPKLEGITTGLGTFYVEEDINSSIRSSKWNSRHKRGSM